MSGSGEVLDFNNTLLEVKAYVKTTDDSSVDVAVAVGPINNKLHSLFSQIDISLNDMKLSSATNTYPYRAYIETHLNYGTDANKSKLQASMYFIDDNVTVSDHIPDSSFAGNMGLKRRHEICTAKHTFDMIGPLHVNVFNQSRCVLNNVTMNVRMTRIWLQTTQPTSGGAVTADSSCCANLPFFGHAGHADPLDGWRCCSQKRVMSRPIQVRQL